MELKDFSQTVSQGIPEQRVAIGLAQKLSLTGVWEIDHANKKLLLSNEILQIFGFRSDEKIESTNQFLDKVVLEDREKIQKLYNSSLEAGVNFEVEYSIQTEDGVKNIFEKSTSFRDSEGKLYRSIHLVQDSSNIRKIEMNLKRSEWNLNSIVECSPSAIFILREEVILYANQAASQLIECQASDMIGAKMQDLLELQGGKNIFDVIQAISELDLLEDGNFREYQLKTRSQEKKWVGFWGVEIFYNDDIANLLYVMDITKKKEAEIQLLQSEKMATIGILAAGVAHEINNPIAFIKSNFQSLQKYFQVLQDYQRYMEEEISVSQPDLGKKIFLKKEKSDIDSIWSDLESLVEESLDGTIKISDIVKDIKSFAHVDTDNIEWVNINQIIKSTINILWNRIKYTTEIELHLAESMQELRCNSRQIGQVFINLLINSIQAIEEKREKMEDSQMGKITITTQYAQEDKQSISIRIQDTGVGIPSDMLHRIYDPFFTTKEIGEGTGLGLSIVLDIIHKHKGKLLVESTVGEGTEFEIILPVLTSNT